MSKNPPVRITEDIRDAVLRRPPPPSRERFTPSVTKDRDVPGLWLIVTRKRALWALVYQARGINPNTGRRYGGGTRHELADALLVGVKEASGLALTAKGLVRAGRSPHHEQMASRAALEASRAILPQTVGQTLDIYATALMARRQTTERSRRQDLHYARRACAFMNVMALPIVAIEVGTIRLMIETVSGLGRPAPAHLRRPQPVPQLGA